MGKFIAMIILPFELSILFCLCSFVFEKSSVLSYVIATVSNRAHGAGVIEFRNGVFTQKTHQIFSSDTMP